MTDPRAADNDVHDLHVRYGLQLETVCKLAYSFREQYLHRAHPEHPVQAWSDLTEEQRNAVRAQLDQLARAELDQLEHLVQLARRVRDRD